MASFAMAVLRVRDQGRSYNIGYFDCMRRSEAITS